MDLTLHVWRQKNTKDSGKMETIEAKGISEHSSFLEMLDTVNEDLQKNGQEPIAFDHDCREGICGSCSLVINGEPHGPEYGTTSCQLHMRSFKSGQHIFIEPWRAKAFPVLRDLVVDRSAFDRIQQAGGFVSVNTGSPQDANCIPVPKQDADKAFELVHKSNMTKLCVSEQEAKDTVKSYESDDRYDSPAYRLSDDGKHYVVYNKSTSKILKSINYNPVKFDSIL